VCWEEAAYTPCREDDDDDDEEEAAGRFARGACSIFRSSILIAVAANLGLYAHCPPEQPPPLMTGSLEFFLLHPQIDAIPLTANATASINSQHIFKT
jgi:hypothetical protein